MVGWLVGFVLLLIWDLTDGWPGILCRSRVGLRFAAILPSFPFATRLPKLSPDLGVAAHVRNLSTHEAEPEELLPVQAQLVLLSQTLSQTTNGLERWIRS